MTIRFAIVAALQVADQPTQHWCWAVAVVFLWWAWITTDSPHVGQYDGISARAFYFPQSLSVTRWVPWLLVLVHLLRCMVHIPASMCSSLWASNVSILRDKRFGEVGCNDAKCVRAPITADDCVFTELSFYAWHVVNPVVAWSLPLVTDGEARVWYGRWQQLLRSETYHSEDDVIICSNDSTRWEIHCYVQLSITRQLLVPRSLANFVMWL